MQLFVWIPGILGSRLERRSNRREVWPPGPGAENGLGDRTYAQLTADLFASKVIDSVCIVPIYSPLDALFARAGVQDYPATGPRPPMARYPFAYDWRVDIESQAHILADELDGIVGSGDEIVFVAHSMGNYLVRYLIETPTFADRPFRACVRKYVSVNGPHAGAPIMLARIMALDKMDHIVAADVPRLLKTPPFAAGCELMPSPGSPGLFNGAAPIDIYDPATVATMGWGAANMATAARLWGELSAAGRAPGVEYVIVRSFVDGDGTGQNTIACVRHQGGRWRVERGPGDGDVPVWSCEAIGRADAVMPGSHLEIFKTHRFAQFFGAHVAPFVDLDFLAVPPSLQLQPLSRDIPASGPARFALVQDLPEDARFSQMEGVLTWMPLTTAGALDLSGRSVKTELVARSLEPATVLTVTAPPEPGVYRVVLEGAADGRRITDLPAAVVLVGPPADAGATAQPPRPPS